MTDYCISFDDERCNKDAVERVGGKNASLGELMNAGVQVPPGFAVTTTFYDEFVEACGIDEFIETRLAAEDLSTPAAAASASSDIKSRITEGEFPERLESALRDHWNALSDRAGTDDLSVAVRSSATAEDLPDASFAGQQDTYLNITSFDAVKERVRDCIASLFTARAISYREEKDFDHDEVKISVGVQKMVDARSSGVMFTLNPANGDRSKVRIESNWGLGEAVVSGSVTPDSFLVDKPVFKIVDRAISTKNSMTVATDDGVDEVETDEEKKELPSLTADEIVGLTDRAKRIESHYGAPQDIEWAIEEADGDKRIYILQSRPETTWNEDGAAGEADDEVETPPASTAQSILQNLSDS